MATADSLILENIKLASDYIPLSVEVHRSFPENQQAWDELVECTSSGIYLTYDWCQAWWTHYGADRKLSIYLVYVSSTRQLIGVLPMFIDCISIGFQNMYLAKTIGSDFTISTCELPILKEWIIQALELIISELTLKENCDAILLGPLVLTDTQVLVQQCVTQMSSVVKLVVHHSKRPHIVFECPETFEDYIKSLGQSTRKSYRNWWNRLCKTYDIKEDIILYPFDDSASFTDFIKMHTAQWTQEGKAGHFGDWPFAEEFHNDLASRQAKKSRFFLFRISTSNKVISYQYLYGYGKTLHWMLPARLIDSKLEKLSLGRVSLVRMLNWAIGEGYTQIDAGAGHYPYKLQLGAKEFKRQSMLIVKNNLVSQWRYLIFTLQGRLLDIIYYKIWYCRIAVRFHIQQPLWKSWIKRQLG